MLRSLCDLIYPRRCEICGELLGVEREFLCEKCEEDIPLTYYWDWKENPAEKILWVRTYLDRVVPLYFYTRESKYSVLIHKIKYQGNIRLGWYLGRMLGRYLKDSLPQVDYIIPVPLHWWRKFRRGYNQAEIIAQGIAQALYGEKGAKGHIITDVLYRKRYTRTQTRRGMGQKWSNVEGVFVLKTPEKLEGKHILLVDDVLTTGATTEAAYTPLAQIENIKVSVATLAYVE